MTGAAETIGVIGLGAMGAPIARRLIGTGAPLAVFDTDDRALAAIVDAGAIACSSPAEVADRASVIFTSLPSPHALRAVATGEDGLGSGAALRLLIDLSTVGPECAASVARSLADAGVDYLDAPVSGGVAGAAKGTLTIMAAGRTDVFRSAQPHLKTLGSNIVHVGEEPGQGQLTKVINNLMSATAIAITAEALVLGLKGGIQPRTLLEAVNGSSGRNTATETKFPQHVLTRGFDFGFRMDLMAKDVRLCLEEAARLGMPMVLGGTVDDLWRLANATSADGADCTQIATMFESWGGVEISDGDTSPA